LKEKALSHAGLHELWLTFLPACLKNFVAACGLARSTAAYDGGFWGLVISNPFDWNHQSPSTTAHNQQLLPVGCRKCYLQCGMHWHITRSEAIFGMANQLPVS